MGQHNPWADAVNVGPALHGLFKQFELVAKYAGLLFELAASTQRAAGKVLSFSREMDRWSETRLRPA